MRDLSQRCAMAVMAKAPLAGRSKTRLVPPLDFSQAAAMSAAFLRDITENIAAATGEGWVAYAPAGLESLFDGNLAAGTQLILADGAIETPENVTGFGKCLLHAIRALLAMGYGAACLVNSDSPTLPAELLARAAAALNWPGERAVLGPAEDGGYYLLGVKQAHTHLFSDIDWSTERVAAQTLTRAREIGLGVELLPAWYDVDDAASLRRLLTHFAGGGPGDALTPYAAPATRAAATRLGLRADAP